MMIREIKNVEEARELLKRIGVHPDAIDIMAEKTGTVNIFMENVLPQDAIIMKQEMLCCGGDVAIPEKALPPYSEKGDILIMGSTAEIKKLSARLARQHGRLAEIGENMIKLMENVDARHEMKIGNKIFHFGEKTYIMGILNITPDSFYDGGKYDNYEKAIERAKEIEREGADIIDVGGESSRPFSKRVDAEEEKRRILPVIEAISSELKIPVSVDTYKPEVAEEAIEKGAAIINDIMGLRNGMAEIAAEHDVPVIIMHMKGTPETMQLSPHYDDVTLEILNFFKKQIDIAIKAGVEDNNIILDPGIGFGKRQEDNIKIISHLREFKSLGKPVLIGASRKSFIGNILNLPPEERLEGSIASEVIAVTNGADIIRCHDVAATKRAIMVADAIAREN